MMIESTDDLEKRFIAIESKVIELSQKLDSTRTLMILDRKKLDDAIWRINELSNWAHSMGRQQGIYKAALEPIQEKPTASCCSAHAGGYDECKDSVDCDHESDRLQYMSYPPQYKCAKCGSFTDE